MVQELVADFLCVFQRHLSNSIFPILQPAIGVGSAFEGWAPHKNPIYCMFVPLKPPHGYSFNLEPEPVVELTRRNFRIRVCQECTCTVKRPAANVLCFLHHPEEELRRNRGPSLFYILCKGAYLDVEKIARWFQNFMKSVWKELPQSCCYKMQLQSSRRSCKLKLTNASESPIFIDLIFGMQQGDSDIFVSSQTSLDEPLTPSTSWPESCSIAEAKLFRRMAREAQSGSCHLNCLQLCAHIVEGTGFSTYTMKTIVMHLLATTPLSAWHRRYLLSRLKDVMQALHCCLEKKRLNHFFFGNNNVPVDIILPPGFREAEPINIYKRLAEDASLHAEALCDI
ncbi:Inositol 1,4,5-trisphosphate receptor-interacting protein-like 1, partial [Colius striatus]